jgi:hypothetical protein
MNSHGTLSGLPIEYIQQFLQAVRALASLPDDKAMAEVDGLLAGLQRADVSQQPAPAVGWEHNQARSEIERLRSEVDRVRNAIPVAQAQLLWDGRMLLEQAQRLGCFWDLGTRTELAAELSATLVLATEVSEAAQVAGYKSGIKECQTRPIHNASTVKSIVAGIGDALEGLSRFRALTDEITAAARGAKERCARYRSQKKNDEADVAQAGGNEKKAERLRKEAAVLLAQDWAQVFTGERPPIA